MYHCLSLIQASKYLDENSRYEMLDVLTHLEGELQAKDVTIAALKVQMVSNDIVIDEIFKILPTTCSKMIFSSICSLSVLNMSYTVFKLQTNQETF